jgi:predicted Zn-dependent protease
LQFLSAEESIMNVIRSSPYAASAAGILLTFALASTTAAQTRVDPGFNLFSTDQEIQIGRDSAQEVERELPLVRDGNVTRYVEEIGGRLAREAPGADYPYQFRVLDVADLNAFALPGGFIYVNRGLLETVRNEEQLAGVLAHEIAHIAERHAADQLTKSLVANGLLGLLGAVLGNDSGGARAARIGAQVLAGGYLLKFSRDDEREADRVGADILRRAGWDARGLVEFMDVLRREQGRNPSSVEVFLSSHPAPGERADLLRRTVRAGGRRDSEEFQRIRARVRAMPPAKSMSKR